MISVIHGLISIRIILSVLILIESCPELCEGLSLEIICKVLSLLIKASFSSSSRSLDYTDKPAC